ncbi:methionyl-tRNA formyltransferase [Microbacterium sp. NPDC089189]|uniref:methionyl-tRNA formyltransferase n=1 Tax=Microbacterium sp. NPDC089189 TaxID=3154972 RepID=UPI00343EE479
MRLVFAGTPDPAVESLRALRASDHEIAAVITRTDAPLGRKRILTPSPVAQAADEAGLPVLKADRLDDEMTARVAALRPDLGVIVAYGALVRAPLLAVPRLGWINLHFSLLPRWRGAAPVQRALIAGDAETGTSVFQLTPGLDEGDVFAQEASRIPPSATADQLLAQLARSGARQLVDVVDRLAAGTATAVAQGEPSTYAAKLEAEDGRLDWTATAETILGRFRGTTPEPGAFTTIDGARLKIHELRRADAEVALAPGALRGEGAAVLVGTGSDPLAIVTVQPAGKSAMAAGDWWRGLRTSSPVAGS